MKTRTFTFTHTYAHPNTPPCTHNSQEVTLLAQLKHPYIIQMLDGFIDENMLIIIFEWAPAGEYAGLFKKRGKARLETSNNE